MNDISVLEQFTLDEIIEAIQERLDPDEWVTEEDGTPGEPQWRHRYMHRYSTISQQVTPTDDGKWKCSSHFGHPSGKFDTAYAAMEAFDDIPYSDASNEKDERETDLNWKRCFETSIDMFKARVVQYYWQTYTYEIYRMVDDQYLHLEAADYRFESSISARIHAEKRLYELVGVENETKNWRQPYTEPIIYGKEG